MAYSSPSILVSGATVRLEERVTILDIRGRFGCVGAPSDKESPDVEPSPLKLLWSSSSLVASSVSKTVCGSAACLRFLADSNILVGGGREYA